MRRLLALFLALALPLQFSWAVAATYCGHETSKQAPSHFGHHVHEHKAAGDEPSGGKLAPDEDCVFHHAGHAALLSPMPTLVAAARPSTAAFPEPAFGASAPARAPDRPQWLRLA